ncbi:MAG TPA: hypothetical protein VGK00_14700 [Anaerolineales bacterium]
MEKSGTLTKGLAITGTVFAWLPILATILTSVAGTLRSGRFRFDYLMPAELFPLALLGAGLLLWAALRAHSRQGLIGWSLAAAAIALLGSQALAVITGLASGKIGASGWPWAVVLAGIAAYALALIVIGIGGVLLLRDLYPDKT